MKAATHWSVQLKGVTVRVHRIEPITQRTARSTAFRALKTPHHPAAIFSRS